MNLEWIVSVFAAFIGWTFLYVASHVLNTSHTWEWHCRRVTLLHAVVITALSGWSAIVEGPWPFTDPAGLNTVSQHWICVITLGYFIFDLLWCLYFNTEGKIMLFHHILSIFGNGMVLTRGINGCEMMATLFGTEITNPLLQSRWFLRQSPKYKQSKLAFAVDISFIVVFTIMRICLASVLLYTYLTHPRPDWIARSGAIAIYVVGWVFWISVLRYGMTKYGSGRRRAMVGIVTIELKSSTSTNLNGYHEDILLKNGGLHEIKGAQDNVLHHRSHGDVAESVL